MDQPPGRDAKSTAWEGSRRRWSRFRRLPVIAQAIGWFPLMGLLLLYLFPWEDLARWFRGADRWQQVAAVAAVVAIAAISLTEEFESIQRENENTARPESTEASPLTATPSATEAPAPEATQTSPSPPPLFPERPGRQGQDIERALGESIDLNGWSATVHEVMRADGALVVSLAVSNLEQDTVTASYRDWRLQTPTGSIVDPGRVRSPQPPNEFNTVDLVPGGSASGDIYFDAAASSGEYYVIFQPEEWDAARGIWGTQLP